MRTQMIVALAVLFTTVCAVNSDDRKEPTKEAGTMLSHDVYFSLKDNSPEATKKLVTACKKYLALHPDVAFFAIGTLAEELKRDVNNRDFDVALHIVFKDKAAHDKYQESKRHKQFIEENKDNWKKVRVFDSAVEQIKPEEVPAPIKIPAPNLPRPSVP